MTGKELLDKLQSMTEEELLCDVWFDTEGKTYKYHLALVDDAIVVPYGDGKTDLIVLCEWIPKEE
jgi:hypothetical protein